MHFPQWIDLKGQDSIPDTVHQVVCMVDPKADKSWIRLRSTKEAGIKVRSNLFLNNVFRPMEFTQMMRFDQEVTNQRPCLKHAKF